MFLVSISVIGLAHAVQGPPDFDECSFRSDPECWQKCEDNNYQTGHCRNRDPERVGPNIECPWNCRSGANDSWDHSIEICEAFGTPPLPPGGCGAHCRSLNGLEFTIDWTGAWYNMVNFCRMHGIWTNILLRGQEFPGTLIYGGGNDISFQVGGIELELEELELDGCNEGRVCFRQKPGAEFTLAFNSPFIYFEGVDDGSYQVRIDSHSIDYATDPSFNAQDGWDVEVRNKRLGVGDKDVDHLFYELETPRVTLSRNGKNFESREALVNYLENSDFFDRLGLDQKQKQNSLGYVLENLIDKPYYYLTVLDTESVEELSQLSVTDSSGEPVETLRKYFTVYPSFVPVETTGGLVFPEIEQSDDPLVKEYGELIVKPHVTVFWK